MREDDVFEPDWKRRRRMVLGVNAFCATAIVYLLGWGNDGALHVNIALGLIAFVTTVDVGYLGLPMLDDRDRRRQFVNFRSTLPTDSRATGAPSAQTSTVPAVTGRVDDPG